MAVTHTLALGREQCFQQIDTLIKSHSLRTSESLCKLLRYLAEHSLDHPGLALKEYQIATEVLGRPAGFDPQSDSTVRVQAGRLRVKLAEYYAQEGPDDPIVVELPKGSYALTFHVRTLRQGAQPPAALALPTERPEDKKEVGNWTRSSGVAVLVLIPLLAISLVTTAILLTQRTHSPAAVGLPIPSSYQIFWNRFVTGTQQP